MQFLLAFLAFSMGFVLSAVGVVQHVNQIPPSEVRVLAERNPTSPLLFLPSSVVTAYGGSPTLIVNDSGPVSVFYGRESDLRAWLSELPFSEGRLIVDDSSETVSFAEVERQGLDVANPLGADLWMAEFGGNSRLQLTLPNHPELAALVASDGVAPSPREIELIWKLPSVEVMVPPIIWVGLGLMFLGALMALIFFILDFKNNGPRRRRIRPPKRPKLFAKYRTRSQVDLSPQLGRRGQRATGGAAMVLGASLMLTGCAAEVANPLLSPNPSPKPEALTSSLTVEQMDRIIRQTVAVVDEADQALDRESLQQRLAGPALELRTAAYTLARQTEEQTPPTPLVASPVVLRLPAATDSWPRTFMAVTQGGETGSQLLAFRQESARDPYYLWYYTSLLPGQQFPDIATPEAGAVALDPDNSLLLHSPQSVVQIVGSIVDEGFNSPFALSIDFRNPYLSAITKYQSSLQQSLADANITISHDLGDFEPILLSTLDGGALLCLKAVDTYRIEPKESGDAISISGDEALLLGAEASASGFETSYGAMLLFYIPTVGSNEQIRLLGATQGLVGVKNLAVSE
jgi:hypothetical protein